MLVRKAEINDLDAALRIYEAARAYMKESGNPDQWGDSYPPESLVKGDIEKGNLYCITDGGAVCGVFAYFPEGDHAYDSIFDGAWLDEDSYGAIHRVAGDGTHRGIVYTAVEFCRSFTPALKIDTHYKNISMQRALEKAGFCRCGTVYTDDGTARIAYHMTKNGE